MQHAQNFHSLRPDTIESQVFADCDMTDTGSNIVSRRAGERIQGKQAPTLFEGVDNSESRFRALPTDVIADFLDIDFGTWK